MSFYITHSGVKVDLNRLDDFKISLDDISHHLSKIQRFGGALPLNISYTVAQHSMHMAAYALEHYGIAVARYALMHDAAEAYLGDIVSPLKSHLKDYESIEEKLMQRICNKYDLVKVEVVKSIDRAILLDEVRTFMPYHLNVFETTMPEVRPLNIKIKSTSNLEIIKQHFLLNCITLGINDE